MNGWSFTDPLGLGPLAYKLREGQLIGLLSPAVKVVSTDQFVGPEHIASPELGLLRETVGGYVYWPGDGGKYLVVWLGSHEGSSATPAPEGLAALVSWR